MKLAIQATSIDHTFSGSHASYADKVNWRPFKGYHYSLKYTAMRSELLEEKSKL